MRALIVEDDLSLQSFYDQILQMYDFEVEIAINGQQAITALQKQKPSFIILDMLLPYIDGSHILDIIAQDECLSKAFVLIASANDQFESETNKVPNAIFRLKPIYPDQIREIIEIVVANGELDC
jgi:DNA-binding response OmpR family regulator